MIRVSSELVTPATVPRASRDESHEIADLPDFPDTPFTADPSNEDRPKESKLSQHMDSSRSTLLRRFSEPGSYRMLVCDTVLDGMGTPREDDT
jgi:hypothetical protein